MSHSRPKLRRKLYQALPRTLQTVAKNGYVLLTPYTSWRKWTRTEGKFVDAFFEDRAEYEGYAEAFMSGRIVDICGRAAAAADEDVTIWDAHREECERLYALVRKLEPDTVVETGVYHGVSTASILVALADNDSGTLHSLDHGSAALGDGGTATAEARHMVRERPSCAEPGSHALPPDREPGWIIPEDLRSRWERHRGPSQRELPGLLAELGGVDLFLHDSDHSTATMLFEFELAWEWLRPGGVLASHHIRWNDAFETFVEEHAARHGLMSYTYVGEHEIPCSSGYAVKE